MEHLFIINPAADKGRAKNVAGWLRNELRERHSSQSATIILTERAGQIIDIIRTKAAPDTVIIACGGDGTLHDIVNAAFPKQLAVGIIPAGSANDFVKTLYPPKWNSRALTRLFDGTTRRVDLALVTNPRSGTRCMVNSAGIGFTGRIADAVRRNHWLKGETLYAAALFTTLHGYHPPRYGITMTTPTGTIRLHEPLFALSIANGTTEGGKFRIAPGADPADGLLDVILLGAIPRHRFPLYLRHYLAGTHIGKPDIRHYRVHSITIEPDQPDLMHIDGEVFTTGTAPVTFTAAPAALTIIG